MRRRLRRCPIGSVFDGSTADRSRGIVTDIGRGLIDAGRHLLFTGRDTGGGLPGVARRLLLPTGDSGGDFVDATGYLLLIGGDPVDALLHRVEIKRHCAELLVIERRLRRECDHVGRVLRNRFCWRQPTE
jgi:hypothetical protein